MSSITAMICDEIKTNGLHAFYKSCRDEFRAVVSKLRVEERAAFFAHHRFTYTANERVAKIKYKHFAKLQAKWMLYARGSACLDDTFVFTLPKCFNAHELERQLGLDVYHLTDHLKRDGYKLICSPKWDGSYLQIFADQSGEIHVYTLSTPFENRMCRDGPTFTDFARKWIQRPAQQDWLTYLQTNPYASLACEVVSVYNRLVTIYTFEKDEEGMIIPLYQIDREGECTHVCPDGIPIEHVSDVQDVFQTFSCNPRYGTCFEGVVLVAEKQMGKKRIALPVCKMKTQAYLEASGTESFRTGASKTCQRIQELVLKRQEDDCAYLYEDAFCMEHRQQFEEALHKASDAFEAIRPALIETKSQKEFAEQVQASGVPRWLVSELYGLTPHKSRTEPNPLLDRTSSLHDILALSMLDAQPGKKKKLEEWVAKNTHWFLQ